MFVGVASYGLRFRRGGFRSCDSGVLRFFFQGVLVSALRLCFQEWLRFWFCSERASVVLTFRLCSGG